MGVVVDSSVFIAKQRGKFDWHGWTDSLGDEELLVTTITLSELLHGAHRAETDVLRDKRFRFAAMLERDYCVLPFGVREARNHAALTAEMQRMGMSAGAHDMLIGAIARCHGHGVATLNVTEFARMPGMMVMDASPFRIVRSLHP